MSTSTLSEILKETQKWAHVEGDGIDGWKKKNRKEHIPILEKHLVEWVYRAQLARVGTKPRSFLCRI